MQTNIIDIINKLTIKINCNYNKIEKDIAIISAIVKLDRTLFFVQLENSNNLLRSTRSYI